MLSANPDLSALTTEMERLLQPSAPPEEVQPSAPPEFKSDILAYVKNITDRLNESDNRLNAMVSFLQSVEREEAKFIREKMQFDLDMLVDELGRKIPSDSNARNQKIKQLNEIVTESKSIHDMAESLKKALVAESATDFSKEDILLINKMIKQMLFLSETTHNERFLNQRQEIEKIKLNLYSDLIYGIEKYLLDKYKELDTGNKLNIKKMEKYKDLAKRRTDIEREVESCLSKLREEQVKLKNIIEKYQNKVAELKSEVEDVNKKLKTPLRYISLQARQIMESKVAEAKTEEEKQIIRKDYEKGAVELIKKHKEALKYELRSLMGQKESTMADMREGFTEMASLKKKILELKQDEYDFSIYKASKEESEALHQQYNEAIGNLQKFKAQPELFNREFAGFLRAYHECFDSQISDHTSSMLSEKEAHEKLKQAIPSIDIMLAVNYASSGGSAKAFIPDELARDPLNPLQNLYVTYRNQQLENTRIPVLNSFYSSITHFLGLNAISQKYGATEERANQMLDLINNIESQPSFKLYDMKELIPVLNDQKQYLQELLDKYKMQSFLQQQQQARVAESHISVPKPETPTIDQKHTGGKLTDVSNLRVNYFAPPKEISPEQKKAQELKQKKTTQYIPSSKEALQRANFLADLNKILNEYQKRLSKIKGKDTPEYIRNKAKIAAVSFVIDEVNKGRPINSMFLYNYMYAHWGDQNIFEKGTLGRINHLEKLVMNAPAAPEKFTRYYLDKSRISLLKELDEIAKSMPKEDKEFVKGLRTLVASGDAFEKATLKSKYTGKQSAIQAFIANLSEKTNQTESIEEVRSMREEKSKEALGVKRGVDKIKSRVNNVESKYAKRPAIMTEEPMSPSQGSSIVSSSQRSISSSEINERSTQTNVLQTLKDDSLENHPFLNITSLPKVPPAIRGNIAQKDTIANTSTEQIQVSVNSESVKSLTPTSLAASVSETKTPITYKSYNNTDVQPQVESSRQETTRSSTSQEESKEKNRKTSVTEAGLFPKTKAEASQKNSSKVKSKDKTKDKTKKEAGSRKVIVGKS